MGGAIYVVAPPPILGNFGWLPGEPIRINHLFDREHTCAADPKEVISLGLPPCESGPIDEP
jgi:hypothetical protein